MTERRTGIRLALVQQAAGPDPSANTKRAEEAVRAAAARGAELVCLSELFRTRYFPQVESTDRFDLAEPIPGATTEQMAALARELGIVLVVPLFERRAAGIYHDSAVILDSDGSMAGVYRKMSEKAWENVVSAAEDEDDDVTRTIGWSTLPERQELYLRMSGLLWPEASQRIANTALLTRERKGDGQIILFAFQPTFRGATRGTTRLLLNAIVYGPGLGTKRVIRPR